MQMPGGHLPAAEKDGGNTIIHSNPSSFAQRSCHRESAFFVPALLERMGSWPIFYTKTGGDDARNGNVAFTK